MAKARKLPSGSWRCQVYSHTETITDSKGKQKKKRIYESFTSEIRGSRGKRDAEQKAAIFAASKESIGRVTDLSFGVALDEYIENRSAVLSPATIREYKRSRKIDFQDLIDVRISDMTQEMIQSAINRAAASHSAKTVRNIHGLLSAVLKTYRPGFALNTKLPQKTRPNLYIPTDSDIKSLMNHVRGNEMEVPILLAAFGPMRRGEICALEHNDIANNIIHVCKALVLNDAKEWVCKAPKTYTSDRYIEFPEFVMSKIISSSGRVVHITPNALSSRFSHLLKNAGIPHFRFHDLRHYCASIQHALGVPDAYIMQRGGWASDAVLKNVYRHAMDDKSKEMSRVANDHFSELCNTKYNTN